MNQNQSDTHFSYVPSLPTDDHSVDDTQKPSVASDSGNGDGTEVHSSDDTQILDDLRPAPRPRKHPQLWQSYLWWFELMEMRKRHLLRISSCERGKSNLDAGFEAEMMNLTRLNLLVDPKNKAEKEFSPKTVMVNYGKQVPVWDWCLAHKGLGEGLTAQLLAQIDDINRFETVSKLWRFCGMAVFDGKAEKNTKGEKSHFNRVLKGVCFNIADMFIKHQTPGYIDIYYAEKTKLKELHPDIVCKNCGGVWSECQSKKTHKRMYNDGHLHTMAWRKMVKEFLKDLWVEWKRLENVTP